MTAAGNLLISWLLYYSSYDSIYSDLHKWSVNAQIKKVKLKIY